MSQGAPSVSRLAQVGLRSVHIAAMGLVLGGIHLGGEFGQLRGAILATLLTGMLLAAVDLAKGPGFLLQGSGAALHSQFWAMDAGHAPPASAGLALAALLAQRKSKAALVQAVATGHVKSLAEGQAALRDSVEYRSYEPRHAELWREGFESFKKVVARGAEGRAAAART